MPSPGVLKSVGTCPGRKTYFFRCYLYTKRLEYTPKQIFDLWSKITEKVNVCNSQQVDRLEIAKIITEEFGDAPIHIRVLLRNKSGPHEELGQAIYAYQISQSGVRK